MTLISRLIAGCKGKVFINTPFGKREIKKIIPQTEETPKRTRKK